MALLRIGGTLSGEQAGRLLTEGRRLAERPDRTVVVDLRLAEFVDSDGIRALIALQGRLEAAGGELRLVVSPGSPISRTLSLLCLQHAFHLYDSAVEAWIRHAARPE